MSIPKIYPFEIFKVALISLFMSEAKLRPDPKDPVAKCDLHCNFSSLEMAQIYNLWTQHFSLSDIAYWIQDSRWSMTHGKEYLKRISYKKE